jgi:hypothetical protein
MGFALRLAFHQKFPLSRHKNITGIGSGKPLLDTHVCVIDFMRVCKGESRRK